MSVNNFNEKKNIYIYIYVYIDSHGIVNIFYNLLTNLVIIKCSKLY